MCGAVHNIVYCPVSFGARLFGTHYRCVILPRWRISRSLTRRFVRLPVENYHVRLIKTNECHVRLLTRVGALVVLVWTTERDKRVCNVRYLCVIHARVLLADFQITDNGVLDFFLNTVFVSSSRLKKKFFLTILTPLRLDNSCTIMGLIEKVLSQNIVLFPPSSRKPLISELTHRCFGQRISF